MDLDFELDPYERNYIAEHVGEILTDIKAIVVLFNWRGPGVMKILLSNLVHNDQVIAHHAWIEHPYVGRPMVTIGNRILFDAECIEYTRKNRTVSYGLDCLNIEVCEVQATTFLGLS